MPGYSTILNYGETREEDSVSFGKILSLNDEDTKTLENDGGRLRAALADLFSPCF